MREAKDKDPRPIQPYFSDKAPTTTTQHQPPHSTNTTTTQQSQQCSRETLCVIAILTMPRIFAGNLYESDDIDGPADTQAR